ncbi:origin recognition complex subunit 2 [Meredithblackwellia eburnea MCA 4105]
MAPRSAKKQKLDHSPSKSSPLASPSKSSAQDKGKQRAIDPPSPQPDPRQESTSNGPDPDGDDDTFAITTAPDGTRKSFVSASSGDAYLLHSARPSKTGDTLLSAFIDPAFTLSSYADALEGYDTSPAATLVSQRDSLAERRASYVKNFAEWRYELEQGFNIILYGFGSKRTILNAFAERAQASANTIIVNGFDPAVVLQDLVAALEELIVPEDKQEVVASKSRKGRASKGKGKAKTESNGTTPAVPKLQVSAIEGRIRKLCDNIGEEEGGKNRRIYVAIHNLDGPVFRTPKNLGLLALLASHPRIHLIATIDHLRAPLIFPSSLSHSRPLHNGTGFKSVTSGSSRAFTFIYHEVTTRAPYSTEVTSSGLLSRLLPQTIFPQIISASSGASFSPVNSAIYVLKSVTARSQKLFELLAQLQLATTETLDSHVARSADLNPAMHSPAPRVASSMDALQSQAVDQLIALGVEQVEALLAEFRDHGVVRSSVVPPEETDEDLESPLWVWIALTADELEEVLESSEWRE